MPRLLLLVAVLVTASCASLASGGAPAGQDARAYFWDRMTKLDLRSADRGAPDQEHRRFVQGMRTLLNGEMAEAEAYLEPLTLAADDSLLRTVSRVVLSAALEYQGKWSEIYDLPDADSRAGLAGIENWARAMRLAPPARFDFPDEPVKLRFLPAVTGTPVVEVKVNGISRWFWIDTGSSMTLLASDVADSAGVTPLMADTFQMITAVRPKNARSAVIERLEIGDLVIHGQRAALLDARDLVISTGRGERRLFKVDGVIGMDILRRLDVRIDFRRHMISLAEPVPQRSSVERNLLWLGHPVVRVENSGGQPLYFGLDTGADVTAATETLVSKMSRRWLKKHRKRIAGFGSDTTLKLATLPELYLDIGGRNFTLSDVSVHPAHRVGFLALDGVLGNDTAAGFVMRIDMTNGIFSIDLAW